MSKQKKEVKISFFTTKIVNLLCLIIGIMGIFVSIIKLEQLNIVLWRVLLCTSLTVTLMSLIILLAFFMVYFQNRNEFTYHEYIKIYFNSKPITNTFVIIGFTPICAIITIILIILTLIL